MIMPIESRIIPGVPPRTALSAPLPPIRAIPSDKLIMNSAVIEGQAIAVWRDDALGGLQLGNERLGWPTDSFRLGTIVIATPAKGPGFLDLGLAPVGFDEGPSWQRWAWNELSVLRCNAYSEEAEQWFWAVGAALKDMMGIVVERGDYGPHD